MTDADSSARGVLLRRGFALEYVTLGWNVAGIVVLAMAAVAARSVALAGFGARGRLLALRTAGGRDDERNARYAHGQ